MTPRPGSRFKAALVFFISSMMAALFWWLFYERYYRYQACIEAAASSCLTAQGDNVTSGGMVWALPAFILSGFAIYYLGKLLLRSHVNKL